MPAKKTNTKRSDVINKFIIPIAIIVSVGLNVIVIVTIIAAKTGVLDYAIVNIGHNVLCSEAFRDNVAANDSMNRVASVDYECQRGDAASQYYLQGFNDYLKSQGIPD